MVSINPPDWQDGSDSTEKRARRMIAHGVILVILGLFISILFCIMIIAYGFPPQESWGAVLLVPVFSLICLFYGFLLIRTNKKILKRISSKNQGSSEPESLTPSSKKEQGLPHTERSSQLIISFFAMMCLSFTMGFLRNNIGSYFFGIGFILLIVNEVLARTSKQYKKSVRRVAHQIVGVTVAASVAIYYTFVNVNLLVAFIGFAIIITYFGYVLFTRYRKKRAKLASSISKSLVRKSF